ncbi:MAG: hypothetical protein ACP5KV_07480 [Candidatus Methanomethylicaceae archaeon]
MKLLMVGCEERGRPLANLCRLNHEVKKLSSSHAEGSADLLRESAKWCDLLFVGSAKGQAYIIADEIWHLLRGKPIVSLTEGLSIRELRDLYPLSKVSRCYVYPDLPTDVALFLLCLDHSFSITESTMLKDLLQSLGDSLLVKEELLESLHSSIKNAQSIVSEIFHILVESSDQDHSLFSYALSWVLYGTGLAAVKGEEISLQSSHLPKEIKGELTRLFRDFLRASRM